MSLPQPRTESGAAGLAALLAEPAAAVLALDFDGTLSPIVSRPGEARAAPGARQVLTRLGSLVRRVAIITGRPAVETVELGDLAGVPGLTVLGHYGLQRWFAGRLDTPAPSPGVDRIRLALPDLLVAAGADPEVGVEDKVHSLVVHTRPCADPDGQLALLAGPLAALAAQTGLEVVPGRLVLELRPPGVDKGTALLELISRERPRAVLLAGDDLGDLPAFAALAAARERSEAAGVSVAVASSGSPPEVEAAADLLVAGPSAFVVLLEQLADRLES